MKRWSMALLLVAMGCAHRSGLGPAPVTAPRAPSRVEIVAGRIAAGLNGIQHGLGPARASGAGIQFSERKLVLGVTEPAAEQRDGLAHVHVVAFLDEAPAAQLDACMFGVGDTTDDALKEASELYVNVVFAPLAAQLSPAAKVAARPFSGDEAYGVPGFRGFVGGVMSTAHADGDSLADAGLFAGLDAIPRDGALHLVKATLMADQGVWWRTLELDGRPTAIAHQPLPGVLAPSTPGRAIRFAVVGSQDSVSNAGARDAAIAALAGRPAWLQESRCPTEIMPARLEQPEFSLRACTGGRLLACLSECESGRSASCYSAALELQREKRDGASVQLFFLRGCRLGNASACTNAAAGRQPIDACSVRTFEKTCEAAGDPWGCAMLGFSLARGEVVPRDLERARRVLPRACALGPEDDACEAAQSLLRQLGAGK